MKEGIIEIPFGAFDSELGGFEYTIPEGFSAEIKDGKVIVKKADSEDEKIRKSIKDCFEWLRDYARWTGVYGSSFESVFAWLEKQEAHTKFRKAIQIGDQVTRNQDGDLVNLSQLKRVAKPAKKHFPELIENEDERIRISLIHSFECCREQEPNGSFNDLPFNDILAWLEKQGEHAKFIDSIQEGDRVTKNQDGVLVNLSQLERVAKPAEKKELKKIEQKPAEWSDVDLISLGYLADFVDKNGDEFYGKNKPNVVKWIRSFANLTTPHQGWSEEDEAMLNDIIGDAEQWEILDDKQIDWLKSLRPQNRWKPSEEQMKALRVAIGDEQGSDCCYELRSLLKDLKSL